MMNIAPGRAPKFAALYKSKEAEIKGDQRLTAGSVALGAASVAAAPVAGPVVSIIGLGSIIEGLLRLSGLKKNRYPAGPKVGQDEAKLKEGAISVAGGIFSLLIPGLLGVGGAVIPMGAYNLYEGLKGKPDVKKPEDGSETPAG